MQQRMGRVTTIGSSVRFRYYGLFPADVVSPQGPPACAPPICGPSPRLSRHDLIAASCWGVIRPPTCFCASWWSCWIFCCFCCGVMEESLQTASIWLCVFSSICLRCCIADCETPACCQQGCLCVGVVPRGETGDVAVCAASGYVPSKVNNVAAQPNHFIFVMETSLCAKPNPRKKVAGKRCWRFRHRSWPSATANYREKFGSRKVYGTANHAKWRVYWARFLNQEGNP